MAELTARTTGTSRRATTTCWATRGSHCSARCRPESEVHTIGVDPAAQGSGIGASYCVHCSTWPTAAVGVSSRSARTTSRQSRCIAASVSTSSGCARATTAQRRRRLHHAPSGGREEVVSIVMGIESSCDETGVGIVGGRDGTASCSRTRWPPASINTPASVAWCPRSPRVPTWRRSCRRCIAPGRGGGRKPDALRSPSVRGWPVRCSSGSPPPRRMPRRGMCRSMRSTTSVGTSRRTSRARPDAAVRGTAGVRRAHPPAARPISARRSSNWAAPSTTPRVRRSTRLRGCWALAFPAARRWTPRPRPVTATRSCSRAA